MFVLSSVLPPESTMEWSKEKTMKLISLLQVNPSIWNPSLCDTRRDKQKRKDELRNIAAFFSISVADATKKIQHLRTQYNRESVREARENAADPSNRFVSNWYAFEYLHFMKDSSKQYRLIVRLSSSEEKPDLSDSEHKTMDHPANDCKKENSPHLHKKARTETSHITTTCNRDEFSVFGEYVANELRSLKGEKNLLLAKKRIQDVIFDVKIGLIDTHSRADQNTSCTVFSHSQPISMHGGKIYDSSMSSNSLPIVPLTAAEPQTSQVNEIVINSACQYSAFKVDTQ